MSILGLGFQKQVADFFTGKTKPVVFPYGKNIFNKDNLIEGKFLNSSGVEVTSSGWRCTDFIWVVGGTKLIASHNLGVSSSACMVIYDANKIMISAITQVDFNTANRILSLPINAEYVRFSLNTNQNIVQIEYGTTSTVYEAFDPTPNQLPLRNTIKTSSNSLDHYLSSSYRPFVFPYGKNMFNKSTVVVDFVINSQGNQAVESTWKSTDYIFIVPNQTIKFSYLQSSLTAGTAFYDAFKTFISWVNNADIIANGLKAVSPAESAYMRCTPGTSFNLDTFQIEYGSISTGYEPFDSMPKQVPFREIPKFDINSLNYPVGTFVPMIFPHGKNIFDWTKAKDDTTINIITGVEYSSSNWFTSDFILVIPGSTIRFSKLSAGYSSGVGVAFYDTSNVYISAMTCSEIVENGNIVSIPYTARKIRICDNPIRNKRTLQVEYGTNITSYHKFTNVPHSIPQHEPLVPFKKIINSNNLDVYVDMDATLHACRKGIYARATSSRVTIYTEGVNGVGESVDLNSSNFPGLIDTSSIIRIFILPFTRNFTNSTPGLQWRLNIVTNKGQVYHNFPARAASSDGTAQGDDYKLFDEGCIWELPERWAPVQTEAGDDATLIATEKYKYYPALPDSAYTFYPAISTDNGYGNTGFPAVLEKTNKSGATVKFARFHQPVRTGSDFVSLDYMGGLLVDEKLSVIGTYRSNTSNNGCRICVFYTNDGGRNWFARYEFGTAGQIINSSDVQVKAPVTNHTPQDLYVDLAAAGVDLFQIVKRSQYAPSAAVKEPVNMFKYASPVLVNSITAASSKITVVTAAAHGLVSGDVIIFEKQSGGASNTWDWMVNSGHTGNSAGDGMIFKVVVINSTSLTLKQVIHNPHNNLACRHIHSLNKSPHGVIIGCGEIYPEGWILLHNYVESDNYARLLPWDTFEFIRLNSTNTSAERPLGFLLKHDGTYIIGMDNESTNVGNITLPEGRNDTAIKKSSAGVYKAPISKIDNLGEAECILETSEVAYFFQEIAGVLVFVGQRGHLAISYDSGKNWFQWKLEVPGSALSRYSGLMSDRIFMIQNHIFHLKG